MEKLLFLELYALGFFGIAIHYVKDWAAHQKRNVQYGLKKVLPTMILSVLTTMILIYLRHDIESLYVITPFSAVVLGYMGNSVFFSFVDAKKPTKLNEED